MESWLAGTPVIATAAGEVVAWHCERSGGGLLYSDSDEFVRQLARLARSPSQASEMAQRGRSYVLSEYSWDVVLDRMEQSVRSL